jgi:hypothetical protein
MGILISCKAFLGYHMAINGDFDMVLVFFLTAGLYYFIKFYFNNNNFAILYSSIFIACAFLTNSATGTADELFSVSNFTSPGDRVVVATDTLNVTYTFNLDAA